MTAVEVITGSRLHFGLLCGAPDSGWHYGGIGLMVAQPAWRLKVSLSSSPVDSFDTSGTVQERLERLLKLFRNQHADLSPVRFASSSEVDFHSGLGSGTQLTLAAGAALLLLSGNHRPADIANFAATLGRNRRSAIGTYGFDHGGFIIDHGRSPHNDQHVLDRIPWPEQWRMLIVTPARSTGLWGETEEQFFGRCRYLQDAAVNQFDRLVRTRISPAVAENRFNDFSDALTEYGSQVGAFYAPAQGGVFSSSVTQDLAEWLRSQRITGVVQSSWGPSVGIPASSAEHAEEIIRRIQSHSPAKDVSIITATGLNIGATIRTPATEPHRSFG